MAANSTASSSAKRARVESTWDAEMDPQFESFCDASMSFSTTDAASELFFAGPSLMARVNKLDRTSPTE
jgi:hypothetical protein